MGFKTISNRNEERIRLLMYMKRKIDRIDVLSTYQLDVCIITVADFSSYKVIEEKKEADA